MIKKLIDKLICRYIVKDLKHLHDISEDKRMKAYAYLYQNVDMMKMLEKLYEENGLSLIHTHFQNIANLELTNS